MKVIPRSCVIACHNVCRGQMSASCTFCEMGVETCINVNMRSPYPISGPSDWNSIGPLQTRNATQQPAPQAGGSLSTSLRPRTVLLRMRMKIRYVIWGAHVKCNSKCSRLLAVRSTYYWPVPLQLPVYTTV